ncbi:MAG: hypothetical protein WCH09_04110, partial [Bacteroidota bacterium]
MGHTSAEDNGFPGSAEYLMGFFDPLFDDISGDLHTTLRSNFLRPFTSYLFDSGHIDFLGYEDLEWGQPVIIDKPIVCGAADYVLI